MASYEERKIKLFKLYLNKIGISIKSSNVENSVYMKDKIISEGFDGLLEYIDEIESDLDILEINYVALQHIEDEKLKELCARNMSDIVNDINETLLNYSNIKFDLDIMDFREYTQHEIDEINKKRIDEIKELEERNKEIQRLIDSGEIPF